jgi:UDP-glucose 4-epimerase
MVKRMTRSQSEIRLIPYEEAYEAGFDDMHRRLPDIEKVQATIQYRPTFDLLQMLERIIDCERSKTVFSKARALPE